MKKKRKFEKENYLTPLTQPSPRQGRGLKSDHFFESFIGACVDTLCSKGGGLE